jgi:hypothetical protein
VTDALPRFAIPVFLGALFALCLYPVWNLEGRWFIVVVVGVALVGFSMAFAGRFSELLMILLLFCVPLAGFAKWSFLDEGYYSEPVRDASLYTGTLGVGIIDFLIVGLYFAWAFRIFVLRTAPLPRLGRADFWVGLIVASYALSLWGAQFLQLGLYALEHVVKHVMVYFYLSRHLRRRHMPWFLAAMAAAVLAEAGTGLLQYRGIVPPGLILDKGAGSDLLEQQYRVPGIEDVSRATGLTYDSHSLGIYLAMLLPAALACLYYRGLPTRVRIASGVILALGLAGVVVTFSRSAWLSTVISLGVTVVALLVWRERHVLLGLIGVAVAGTFAAPWVLSKFLARLFDAPKELLSVRFEQYPIAWSIWRDNFLFGTGAGNYMERMHQLNRNWSLPEPVHNVPLFIAAELGLFGLVVYYAVVAAAIYRLWLLARGQEPLVRRVAIAGFAGLLAYVFDGMSDPLFREPTVYMHFWIVVAFSVALSAEAREHPPAGRAIAS